MKCYSIQDYKVKINPYSLGVSPFSPGNLAMNPRLSVCLVCLPPLRLSGGNYCLLMARNN